MLAEFRSFLTQTNALALAIGVIIGASLGAVVNSLVNDIIMPPIGWALGGVNFADLKIVLGTTTDAEGVVSEVAIRYGAFINAIIVFVIVALVVFLIARTFIKEEEAATPSEGRARSAGRTTPSTPPGARPAPARSDPPGAGCQLRQVQLTGRLACTCGGDDRTRGSGGGHRAVHAAGAGWAGRAPHRGRARDRQDDPLARGCAGGRRARLSGPEGETSRSRGPALVRSARRSSRRRPGRRERCVAATAAPGARSRTAPTGCGGAGRPADDGDRATRRVDDPQPARPARGCHRRRAVAGPRVHARPRVHDPAAPAANRHSRRSPCRRGRGGHPRSRSRARRGAPGAPGAGAAVGRRAAPAPAVPPRRGARSADARTRRRGVAGQSVLRPRDRDRDGAEPHHAGPRRSTPRASQSPRPPERSNRPALRGSAGSSIGRGGALPPDHRERCRCARARCGCGGRAAGG